MNEEYVQVYDWQVRYARAGAQGPALILLHGLGTSFESWWYNLDTLGEQYRVFAPDLLYFGKTTKPERKPAAEDFPRFVTGFMDAMGLERAFVLGHSMGGLVATKTALDQPERVRGLVLADPAGFGRELAWWLRLRTLVTLNINTEGKPPPWMMNFGLGQLFYDPSRVSTEMIDALTDVAQTPGLLHAYQQVIRFGVDWRGLKPEILQEIRDRADEIRVPTLVIWGKQDRVVPVTHARALGERVPNVRIEIFDHCGHAPMIEYPDTFNALVIEFIDAQCQNGRASVGGNGSRRTI